MLNELTIFKLRIALVEELLKLLVVNLSPPDGASPPLPQKRFKLRKCARYFAKIDERNVGRPAFDDNLVALDDITEIMGPVHLCVLVLSDFN